MDAMEMLQRTMMLTVTIVAASMSESTSRPRPARDRLREITRAAIRNPYATSQPTSASDASVFSPPTTIVYHMSSPKALLARPRATRRAGRRRSGAAVRLPSQAATAALVSTPMNATATQASDGRTTCTATAATQTAVTRAAHSVRRTERAGASEGRAVMGGSLGSPESLQILAVGVRP